MSRLHGKCETVLGQILHESGTGTMLIAQVDVESLMLMAYCGSRQAMCALFSMPKDVWRIAEQSFPPSWQTQPRKNTL